MEPAPHAVGRTVAVVGLSGRALRYAEVVHDDGGPRLRRLGLAEFDLDVERALYGDGDSDALEALAEALDDALGGTDAETLVVAAHPTTATSFFTPLPAGLAPEARDAQLRQETALLADLAPTQTVRVLASHVRTEPAGPFAEAGAAERDWFHVVHVGEPVHVRLALLSDALGVGGYTVAETTRAAAAVADPGGVALVVGAYGRHTEVAVVRDGAFLFGTHGPSTAPPDTAYFALAALQQARVPADEVAHVLAYGDDATDARLALVADFLARPVAPLAPFARFRRQPDADAAEAASFGPVVGAAL